jgi:hypothetical protein
MPLFISSEIRLLPCKAWTFHTSLCENAGISYQLTVSSYHFIQKMDTEPKKFIREEIKNLLKFSNIRCENELTTDN